MIHLQRTAFQNAAAWKGGAGSWSPTDRSRPDFKVGDGNRYNAWASNPTPGGTTVTLAAPPGAVVANAPALERLSFAADGYTVSGTLSFPSGSAYFHVEDGVFATVSATVIAPAGTVLSKTGEGTLVYAGTALLDNGIVVENGTLRLGNTKTTYPGMINTGTALEFANPADVYITGTLVGSGVIRKTGPGFLYVNGANAGARDFVPPAGYDGTFDVPVLNRPPVFTGAPSVVVCRAGTLKPIGFLVTDPDGDAITSMSSGAGVPITNGSVTNLSIAGCDYTPASGSSNQQIDLAATDALGATGVKTIVAWNFSSSAIFVESDGAAGSYSAASDVVVLSGVATGRATKWSPVLTGSNTFTLFCTQTPAAPIGGVALSGNFSGFAGTFQVGTGSPPPGCSLSGVITLGDPEAGAGSNAFVSGANAAFAGTAATRAQVFVANMGGGSLTQTFRLGAYATAYFKTGAYAWTGGFTGGYGDFSNSSSTSYLLIRTDASVALSTSSAGVLCEWSVDTPTTAVAGTCTLPNDPDLSNFKFIARGTGSDIGGTFTKVVFSWTGAATGMPVIYHAGFNIATPTLSGGKYYYALQSSADPALALTGVLDLTARTFALVRVS